MNVLISKADRQLSTARAELSALESTTGSTSHASDSLLSVESGKLGEISAGLATAMLTLRNLDESLSRETDMEKRQAAKQLKELKGEHESLKTRLEQIKIQLRATERSNNRSALFSTPTSTATSSASASLTGEILAAREDATLRHAETSMNEYISIGTGTLDSLRAQRALLKGTHRRILDAGTRLGLSQSVMKIISRKTAQDRFIFYLGVITVFGVIYWCWKYL